MTTVNIIDTTNGLQAAVQEMFALLTKQGVSILKESREVYIKVNGIDFKKHCYTSPQMLEAVILTLYNIGAKKVYVMENSTQSNMTRVVFGVTEYYNICKKTGSTPVYLDEEKSETFTFRGKKSAKEQSKGYLHTTFSLPKTIIKLMKNRDAYTYINLPKLKTHSMTGVTLGIKNQWGLIQHFDRGKDHNFNLHSKLVDVFEYIQPDITIIDGEEATVYGHYPLAAFADKQLVPFNIIIGGSDTVAVDVVGARVLGLTIDEVPHLKIAHERGLGEGRLAKIKIVGKSIKKYTKKYSWDLIQQFPEDVKIVKGKKLLCQEGCKNNPLSLLQTLTYDHNGKGGFFLVIGKGFPDDIADQLERQGYTQGLVAGYCAIDEVGEKLRNRFGKKKVFFSNDCNNLSETAAALFKLTGVNALDMVPISVVKSLRLFIIAKLHGSKAMVPPLF